MKLTSFRHVVLPQDKPPATEVLQNVVLEWLKKRKRQKRKAQREYQLAYREYEAKMTELETILAARAACVHILNSIAMICSERSSVDLVV